MSESLKSGREMILDEADIEMMMPKGPIAPGSFDKAYKHSDLGIQELNGEAALIKS
jgi:predicted RNA-binding protein associated with RNAse of E/G family